jgi:hypothetical protein
VDRSRRRGFLEMQVISLFGIYPQRCLDCQKRFWTRCAPFLTELRVRATTAPPRVRTFGTIVLGLTVGLLVASVYMYLNRSHGGPAPPTLQDLKRDLKDK